MARSSTAQLARNLMIRRDFAEMVAERWNGKRKYTVEYVCEVLARRYYLDPRTIYLVANDKVRQSSILKDVPDKMAQDIITLYPRTDIHDLTIDIDTLTIRFQYDDEQIERRYTDIAFISHLPILDQHA